MRSCRLETVPPLNPRLADCSRDVVVCTKVPGTKIADQRKTWKPPPRGDRIVIPPSDTRSYVDTLRKIRKELGNKLAGINKVHMTRGGVISSWR